MRTLAGKELIAQYVLECRGQGHCLPYVDYEVIDEWLRVATSEDHLLMVLGDVLPKFYQSANKGPVRTLVGARNLVIKALRENRGMK